jgi:hypothetical protein
VLPRLLSQLDQAVLFNSVNFQLDSVFADGLGANRTVMMTTVATFLCPSDSEVPVTGYARLNYRFCIGPIVNVFNPSESVQGVFGSPVSMSRAANLTDGLSNTAGVSERLQGDWTKGVFKPNGDFFLGTLGYYYGYVGPDKALEYCGSLAAAGAPHESRGGESWFLFGCHFSSYNHCSAPNRPDLACSFDNYVDDILVRAHHTGSFPASSAHSDGVNVLMMGGNVQFVRNSVDLRVWRAMATVAGGEVVSGVGF